MTKPRDRVGNDFIIPCGLMAMELFYAKYNRHSIHTAKNDDLKIRMLSDDLYRIIMQHWRKWE